MRHSLQPRSFEDVRNRFESCLPPKRGVLPTGNERTRTYRERFFGIEWRDRVRGRCRGLENQFEQKKKKKKRRDPGGAVSPADSYRSRAWRNSITR